MRRAALFLAAALALACTAKAGAPTPPPPPDRLSEADSNALARVVLEEERVCAPVRQRRMEVLKVMEEKYQFSVEKGDQLDERFLLIRRLRPVPPKKP
jgi:hypothetical protein